MTYRETFRQRHSRLLTLEPSQSPADNQKLISAKCGGDGETALEDPFGEVNTRPLSVVAFLPALIYPSANPESFSGLSGRPSRRLLRTPSGL